MRAARLSRIVVLTAALALTFGAHAQSYPYDLAEKDPQVLAALQALFPERLKSVEWIYLLHGTATPLEKADIGGMSYLAGWVCKPHDCGANQLGFLVSQDRSRAVALLRIAADGGDLTFGNPTAAELERLKTLVD